MNNDELWNAGKSLKESLKEKVSEGNQDKYLKQDRSLYNGVYLFSFDLVNSTSFKANFKYKWHDVFTRFYNLIEMTVIEKVTKQLYKDIH